METGIQQRPSVEVITQRGEVIEVNPQRPEAIRDEIKTLSHEISAKFLRLAQLLRVVQKARLYMGWGYDSFESWATGDTDLHPETARVFVQLEATLVEEQKIPREVLAEIGWTKAKPLISLAKQGKLTPRQKEIIEKAKTLPTALFTDYVNQVRAGGSIGGGTGTSSAPEPSVRTPVTFFLSPDQTETITRARGLAEQMTGSLDPGHQLTSICQDFLGSVMEDDAAAPDTWRAKRAKALLSTLEGLFGLVIEVRGGRTEAGQRVYVALDAGKKKPVM